MASSSLTVVLVALAAMGACATDSAEGACGAGEEPSSMLQVRAQHAGAALDAANSSQAWTWRILAGTSRMLSCDEVCEAYGSTCVQAALRGAWTASDLDAASRGATGSGCPSRDVASSDSSFSPYFFEYQYANWMSCRYPSSRARSTCGARPSYPYAQRYCPCATNQKLMESMQNRNCLHLKGSYCPGNGCDNPPQCNYCDDFTENTRCANVCRVLNGFQQTGFSAAAQQAQWTRPSVPSPTDAPNGVQCGWMRWWGDNCQNCDEFAMACRRQNPEGACPAA